jgi:hypothetical protein
MFRVPIVMLKFPVVAESDPDERGRTSMMADRAETMATNDGESMATGDGESMATGDGESMAIGDGESMMTDDGESMMTDERAGEPIDSDHVVPMVEAN